MVIEQLPRSLVDDLERPAAYPDDPTAAGGVVTLQTHLSHLFLTHGRVVKLRKAVKLPFLDFSRRADRVADCHHEVSLNRRLAPDVYLGVAAARRVGAHFVVRDLWEREAERASAGDQPECVVVMRRLEEGGDALSLLENGALNNGHIDAIAATLARFHDQVGLGRPAPLGSDEWWERCYRPVASTLESLVDTRPDELSALELARLSESIRQRFDAVRPRIEQRRQAGMAVDGHGDVHLQHVWFEQRAAGPVLIDCLEFDANLRQIDAASEVAFLAMDLAYRGRHDLAARFLRKYAEARDDFGLFGVVDAYQAYRAAVRAKVAALAARDPEVPAAQRKAARESTRRHLALAAQVSATRDPGSLVLVCGTVGVGKSVVAEELAERTGGVAIGSDRTRKRMAGVPVNARLRESPDEGMYAPERTDAVYRALLDRADAVVLSGRVAILDATFGRAELRKRAREWARRRGVECLLVQVHCAEGIVLERVRQRSAGDADPSDAGPELVEISRSRFMAATEWPARDTYDVHTDGSGWRDELGELLARLLGET